MPKNNMYSQSVFQWNPFVGCQFDCIYCRRSFQAQLKRQKHRCLKCYNYEPHEHPERLDQHLPPTRFGQFIFTCANGDISFCSTEYLESIVEVIRNWPNRTFLIQSKNPKTFERIEWPKNVILGTTIESDRDTTGISKAPSIHNRTSDFLRVKHLCKMVTVEPVMDFNLNILLGWIYHINPCMVWLDLDTIKLCEQSGFALKERLKRKLTQQSFWRTIYYKKYPNVSKIEYEDVLVFEKRAV